MVAHHPDHAQFPIGHPLREHIPGLPDDRDEVRVRFSPSPTGALHIGGAKTALFNWLFARGEARRLGRKGTFILRIEDTDRNRHVEGATEDILDILRWFGTEWQEGPDVGGPHAPYYQSQRTEKYREAAERLVAETQAYRCFCTPERLQQVREARQAQKLPPGYDRHCRNLPHEEIDAKLATGEPHVVRFAVPREGDTTIDDLIRGPITTRNETLEDLVLLKSDGYPTYHLANVIDDHEMRITHVMRAAEWIPTAPFHALLYTAFGWEMPALCHVPLILAPGGGKLSKRHGSTAAVEFRSQGYLPEALMNYLALLGWSFDETTEIFSKDDLLEKFSVARMSPSPATFDYDKLRWFNQHYINHIITLDDLTTRVIPFLAGAGLIASGPADATHSRYAEIRAASELLKDRLETLADASEHMRPFLQDDLEPYAPETLVPKKTMPEDAQRGLSAVLRVLDEVDLHDEAATEARMRALAEELGLKTGQLFMAIRVAVTGRTQSPGLFGTLRVVGADRCRARIEGAVAALEPLVAAPVGG